MLYIYILYAGGWRVARARQRAATVGGNRVTWLHNTSRHVGVTDEWVFFFSPFPLFPVSTSLARSLTPPADPSVTITTTRTNRRRKAPPAPVPVIRIITKYNGYKYRIILLLLPPSRQTLLAPTATTTYRTTGGHATLPSPPPSECKPTPLCPIIFHCLV